MQKDNINKLIFGEPPKACTQEAKLCPDGSSVGRTGPNCEFALCPSVALCEGGACPSASLNQTVLNEDGDFWGFNMGDSIILYWTDVPSNGVKLVFYRSNSASGPWTKIGESPVFGPQNYVDGVSGNQELFYRADVLANSGSVIKSYSILEIPKYIDESGNTETDVSTWKTYRNEEYGFEVRYPSGWSANDFGSPIQFQEKGITIVSLTLGDLSVMGVTYCGAYPDDERCERLLNGVMIDWGTDTPTALIAKDSVGYFFTLHSTEGEEKNVFRNFLSTFKFIK